MANTSSSIPTWFHGAETCSNGFGIWEIPRAPLVAQISFLSTSRRISAIPSVAIAR